jgi:predicted alpha/beta hydrolase family esterase
VKYEKAEELARHLGVEVNLIPGAGHFNASAGYTAFEVLLNAIKSLQ